MSDERRGEDRRAGDGLGGVVIWITGLSGAGKSVIAQKTHELIRSHVSNVVLTDGDEFRALMGDELGHDHQGRLKNAYRIARFCKFLADQDTHVVCATMSLFPECQEWNREHIKRYFEVYVRVPLEELVRRDPKGLYARTLAGEEQGLVGIDLAFTEPRHPDLVIDNGQERSDFTDVAREIVERSGCLRD